MCLERGSLINEVFESYVTLCDQMYKKGCEEKDLMAKKFRQMIERQVMEHNKQMAEKMHQASLLTEEEKLHLSQTQEYRMQIQLMEDQLKI